MIVERISEVLALPTEQKELLAEELLNQVALEKEKDPALLNLLRQRLAEHGADPASGFHASFPLRPPRQPPLRRAKPTARFSAQDFRGRLRARAGIEFTEEHALFRFRPFLHRFDAFRDGAHGPKLWHALAVSGKGMKKLGIRAS
jgi:hypothetical protein